MKHFMVQVTMQHLVTGGGPDIDVTLVFETSSFRKRKKFNDLPFHLSFN